MPRKARSYKKNKITPDAHYNNVKISKFINYLMIGGKKSIAEKVLYNSFEIIHQRMNTEPRQIFDAALKNISPQLEVKGRRVGGANYQVPVEVFEPRKTTLGMRWLISATRLKKGKPMAEKLADEIIEAYNKQGVAFKKKEDTHRMAEANKAFAHFARFMRKKKS